jgi:hypothetical protein
MKKELLKHLKSLDNLLSDDGIRTYDYIYEIEYKNIEMMIIKNILDFNDALIMINHFALNSIKKELLRLENKEQKEIHKLYIYKLINDRKIYKN